MRRALKPPALPASRGVAGLLRSTASGLPDGGSSSELLPRVCPGARLSEAPVGRDLPAGAWVLGGVWPLGTGLEQAAACS